MVYFYQPYHYIQHQTGESELPENVDVFKEWTSKRTWKERKRARKGKDAHLVPGSQSPDLIYYGRHSGVVGLMKDDLFKNASDRKTMSHGYDKVNSILI